MRGALAAIALSVAILGGSFAVEQALAQQGGQQSKQKARPAPPPPMRCPDLAIGTYAFVSQIPGDAPLAPNEIAIQWIISNAGTAAYESRDPAALSLRLDFMTAAGAQPITSMAAPSPAPTGGVMLAQHQSWHGYLRATLPPEAQRRRLRLRLSYAGEDRIAPNDCSTTNNVLMLSPVPPRPS